MVAQKMSVLTSIAAAYAQDWRPQTERDRTIMRAQLDLAARAMRPIVWVIPPSTLVIAYVYTLWGSAAEAAPWILLTWLGCVGTEIVGRSYCRRNAQGLVVDPHIWVLAVAGVGTAFVTLWGSMAIFLWAPGNDLNHMYLTLILACSVAATCVLNGSNLVAVTPQVCIYWLYMFVPALIEGGAMNLGAALLSTAFCILMFGAAIGIRMTTYDMLWLREEKTDLVDRLATERDDAERAKIRAESASRAKSDFLANMSHELRTPLNAILGFSEVMKSEVFGPLGKPIYIEYSGHIHSSGEHLLGLINDILDLSRIEAGRMTLNLAPVDLELLGHDALSMVKHRADAAGAHLRLRIAPDLPECMADQRALRQVLLNLLSNAVKFTPKDGTITLFARPLSCGGIEFGVADTGAGIAPNDLKKVFEPFGQGQHDIAVCEKGTGLGLPIVKGLIEAHGGSVRLESELGKGTTVTVTFPHILVAAQRPLAVAS
jgi:two-component system, cell cycle sensor histidine kinase PleC